MAQCCGDCGRIGKNTQDLRDGSKRCLPLEEKGGKYWAEVTGDSALYDMDKQTMRRLSKRGTSDLEGDRVSPELLEINLLGMRCVVIPTEVEKIGREKVIPLNTAAQKVLNGMLREGRRSRSLRGLMMLKGG